MHKTEIHSMNISASDNAASTSTQISKVTESISRVLTIPASLSRHAAEILWVLDAFLTVTTTGINLTRKMTSQNVDHDRA